MPLRAPQPTFLELFTPKLFTVLREGYGRMPISKPMPLPASRWRSWLYLCPWRSRSRSGVTPERGLYTAIVGGFLVSLLGGSRVQIGGPAGCFSLFWSHRSWPTTGYDGLVLATLVGGTLLIVTGFLQLGTFIKYIPYPVTVGFTSAGIAVIIAVSQIPGPAGIARRQQAENIVPAPDGTERDD